MTKAEIPALNPAMFNARNHESDWGTFFGLDFDVPNLRKRLDDAIVEHAVGFCRWENLPWRSIEGTVGVMCWVEDKGKFWFHLKENTFNKLFEEAKD